MTSDRTVRNEAKTAAADVAKGIGSGAGAWETLPMIQFPQVLRSLIQPFLIM
jgi:hypothetical protein